MEHMSINRPTLEALLSAAKRAAVLKSEERMAIRDAEQALAADDLDRFPVDENAGGAEQLSLFDVAEYEV